MAAKNPLDTILERLNTIDKKLENLPKIAKDIATTKKAIATIQTDIELIKNCVSTENADLFPSIVRKTTKAKGGGKRAGFAMAAASK